MQYSKKAATLVNIFIKPITFPRAYDSLSMRSGRVLLEHAAYVI